MNHTDLCERLTLERAQQIEEWVRKWPNYCIHCGGSGIISESFDPSPSGVSLSSGFMTDTYSCSYCADVGICPRCATHVVDYPCVCGFDFNDMKPEPYECNCWEIEADDAFDKFCNNFGLSPNFWEKQELF